MTWSFFISFFFFGQKEDRGPMGLDDEETTRSVLFGHLADRRLMGLDDEG